jgi:hypothetical protein
MKKLAAVMFAVVLSLSACSSEAAPDAAAGTPTPTASVVETSANGTPASVPTAETTAPAEPDAPAPNDSDRTALVLAALPPELQALVITAEQPELGRLNVQTTIEDPRGENGSTAAVSALAICEALVAVDGTEYISIFEADGTTFVLFGHPTLSPDGCTEV